MITVIKDVEPGMAVVVDKGCEVLCNIIKSGYTSIIITYRKLTSR